MRSKEQIQSHYMLKIKPFLDQLKVSLLKSPYIDDTLEIISLDQAAQNGEDLTNISLYVKVLEKINQNQTSEQILGDADLIPYNMPTLLKEELQAAILYLIKEKLVDPYLINQALELEISTAKTAMYERILKGATEGCYSEEFVNSLLDRQENVCAHNAITKQCLNNYGLTMPSQLPHEQNERKQAIGGHNEIDGHNVERRPPLEIAEREPAQHHQFPIEENPNNMGYYVPMIGVVVAAGAYNIYDYLSNHTHSNEA